LAHVLWTDHLVRPGCHQRARPPENCSQQRPKVVPPLIATNPPEKVVVGIERPDSGRVVGNPEATILLVLTSAWPVIRSQYIHVFNST